MKNFTVVIPFHNEEATIRRTIDSLMSIADLSEVQIICVDDASADNSRQELDLRNIELFKHELRMGVNAARNTGIKHAIGKYVIILDAGMYVAENFFKLLQKNIEDYPETDAFFGFYQSLYKEGDLNICRDICRSTIGTKMKNSKIEFIDFHNYKLFSGGICCIRKELFDDIQFNSIDNVTAGGDLVFQLKAMNSGYEFAYIGELKAYHDDILSYRKLPGKIYSEIIGISNVFKEAINYDYRLPFSGIVLSYPFILLFALILQGFVHSLLAIIMILLVFELVILTKVFRLKNYTMKQKLGAFIYALAKETIKIPLVLIYIFPCLIKNPCRSLKLFLTLEMQKISIVSRALFFL